MAHLTQQLHELPLPQGELVSIAPGVRRLVCFNDGPMTGPGTNCYVLGQRRLTVIDPGPLDERIIRVLTGAGAIAEILVTHTHRDHSPAAKALAEHTGARLIGAPLPDDGHQDVSLVPDQLLADGLWLQDGELPLQAVHTPGHVGNHFCFWQPDSGLLFSGDHIMQGATVVIIPPSGNMADYIASVQRLKNLPIARLAPGHGHLIADVNGYLDRLVEHRLAREARVVDALAQCSAPVTLPELTPLAYADVDPSLHRVAAYSAWAHLIKLRDEGRVIEYRESHWLFDQTHWALATQ